MLDEFLGSIFLSATGARSFLGHLKSLFSPPAFIRKADKKIKNFPGCPKW
jgi:hypothetical protein